MFLSRKLLRLRQTVSYACQRNVSIISSLNTSPVIVSANKDVYTNLALEHWLYTNLKFDHKGTSKQPDNDGITFREPVVLIWTDEPSVVMGRHQNPWTESTVGFINKAGVKLARRHSGGGCVYHDESNINISIIGDRSLFEKRQDNLKFLAKVLDQKYGIKCEPTKRHDLVHHETGLKISGSAAKLGRYNCYHHFTVLVDTDKEALYTAIRQKQQEFVHTNSSLSTRSKVINLKDIKSDLDVEQVISDLANAYGEHYGKSRIRRTDEQSRQTGEKDEFESLSKFKEELQSWDWIYGKTPKFKLERSLKLMENNQEKSIKMMVQVNKGLFEDISIDSELSGPNPSENFRYLIGTQFTYKEAMVNVAQLLKNDESVLLNSTQLFATFLLQLIHESNY